MKNIYLCGPTVYNTPHIGNMRPILTFDIAIRSFRYLGEEINFIHNITDIDDKIIKKSIEENKTEKEIADRYTMEYMELLINYNIEEPTYMPKVTENIGKIIEFIKVLVEKDIAYELNGSVYFSINKDDEYGKISNRNIEDMIFEESNKRHPGDFAIWKNTTTGITFSSPWSEGRPGWHTECSVFINFLIKGEKLDIHGGGVDLIFPHHENENSQYKMINNNNITKEWKHIGHLRIENEKMSKSLGNIITADDFADLYGPDTLRTIILTTSPTGPVEITKNIIVQSQELVEKYTKAYARAQLEVKVKVNIKEIAELISHWKFAEALKIFNNIIKTFNKNKECASELIEACILFGFNFSKNIINVETKEKYTKWKLLREKKEYEEADNLRDELKNQKLI